MKEIIIGKKLTNIDTDSFKRYLSEISKMPILTPKEEQMYAIAAKNGNEKAIEILIECNLRFVVSVAKMYVDNNCLIEDLVDEGNEGLIIAARRFDPDFGFKFISYAVWWIRNRILEFKSNHSRAIRIPINKINEINELKKNVGKFESENDRMPTIDEIDDLDIQDWDDEKIKELNLINALSVSSLDFIIDDEGNTFKDVIANTSIENTDHLVIDSDNKLNFKRFLEILTPLEIEVLTKLYGLGGGFPMTLEDVGDKLNVSRERIRQIREKAFKTLRIKAVKERLSLGFFGKN